MAKWKVINKHPLGFTHREKFRDEMIEIPANGHVLMDYEEAVLFRSQYFPMKKKPTGEDDPKGFKVIHLEPMDGAPQVVETKQGFICHFDGMKFPTQASLDFHIKENYADQAFKDEALEEEIKKEKETTVKRGPGRPKEKSA